MSCNLSSGIAERAAKAAAEKARLELLYELVHDELITLQVGAGEAGLMEEEF